MLAKCKLFVLMSYMKSSIISVGITHLLHGQLVFLDQHLLERPELELLDVPQLAGAVEEVARVPKLHTDDASQQSALFADTQKPQHARICATVVHKTPAWDSAACHRALSCELIPGISLRSLKKASQGHALSGRSLPPRHPAQQLHEERQLILVPVRAKPGVCTQHVQGSTMQTTTTQCH